MLKEEIVGLSLRSSEKTRVKKQTNQTFAYIEMVHEFRRERWGKIQENLIMQIELYITETSKTINQFALSFKIF